jgi:YOP proteins translocation protein K (YscK)
MFLLNLKGQVVVDNILQTALFEFNYVPQRFVDDSRLAPDLRFTDSEDPQFLVKAEKALARFNLSNQALRAEDFLSHPYRATLLPPKDFHTLLGLVGSLLLRAELKKLIIAAELRKLDIFFGDVSWSSLVWLNEDLDALVPCLSAPQGYGVSPVVVRAAGFHALCGLDFHESASQRLKLRAPAQWGEYKFDAVKCDFEGFSSLIQASLTVWEPTCGRQFFN